MSDELSREEATQLFAGRCETGPPLDVDVLRELWRAHQDEILAAWIVGCPGTRPWAFWYFDCEELPPCWPREEAQCDRLELLGLLTEEEQEFFYQDELPFRPQVQSFILKHFVPTWAGIMTRWRWPGGIPVTV